MQTEPNKQEIIALGQRGHSVSNWLQGGKSLFEITAFLQKVITIKPTMITTMNNKSITPMKDIIK